jgi:hypothetical protein
VRTKAAEHTFPSAQPNSRKPFERLKSLRKPAGKLSSRIESEFIGSFIPEQKLSPLKEALSLWSKGA